jgi:predicted transcriptional regulator
MGSLPPNSERLLGVILTDSRHCKCRNEDGCPPAGSEWCRNIPTKGNTSSCCWVLADVEKLASEYLAEAGVPGPPVPSELIDLFDNSKEIEVRLVPLKALHGVVWLLRRGWIIQLNSRDPSRVRRYSMFHEAFHIACRITYPAFDRAEARRTSFKEVLADYFAACFLMPKEWVEEYWPEVQDIRAMAGRFDVPLSQMRRRLNQLNLL